MTRLAYLLKNATAWGALSLALWRLPAMAQAAPVDYELEIKPLLAARCGACHGALRQKGALRLDTVAGILKGGESGPAAVTGKSAESLIVGAITGEAGFQMPPAGDGEPLDKAQVALVRRWIDEGLAHPDKEEAPADPRSHWAYQPPKRSPVPTPKNSAWAANPIDAFLAAEHEVRGLTPAPAADTNTLYRRLYIDLLGLPPGRDELKQLAANHSADEYERVVDRLLASPRYGERWGRHWMDVWRYSDWYGKRDINQHRNSRKNIWRFRDWIIESVNADRGYDQMVVEMLAGDELAPGNEDTSRATGYLGRNFYVYNRNVWLQDTVEYTGMAFLGVTFKCCRCHDHKYDPVTQAEYYQFRACFEPYGVRTDRMPGKPDTLSVTNSAGSAKEEVLKEGYDRVFDEDLSTPTYVLTRGNERSPEKDRPIAPGVPAILGGAFKVQPVALPVEAYYPALREFVEQETNAALLAKVGTAQTQVDQAIAALTNANKVAAAAAPLVATTAAKPDDAADTAIARLELDVAQKRDALAAAEANVVSNKARYTAERAKYATPAAADARVLAKAAAIAERAAAERQAVATQSAARHAQFVARDAQSAKPEDAALSKQLDAADKALASATAAVDAARKALQDPGETYTPIDKVYPAESTGRRLALARWITDRENPLAARVAVNHIWLRHFGAPLVASVENFGLRGATPTHPQLLDWLAVELVENHWSMKRLHRLMVTSQAYRMQSSPADSGSLAAMPPNSSADPENKYLWRMNVRRLEGEGVRDSLLALAGVIDETMGGPDLDPAEADRVRRRSVYFRHTPDDKPALVEMFDAANPVECYRRIESVVPHQALVLANGPMSLDHSRLIAAKVAMQLSGDSQPATAQAVSPEQFVTAAWEHVLARSPSEQERQACVEFLARQTKLLADPQALVAQEGEAKGQVAPAADPALRAREALVHVLFNHPDFVTVR